MLSASKQQASKIDCCIQSASRKRICILRVAEIASGVQQAQVNHGAAGYRGGDSGAGIAGHQPTAGHPKRCRRSTPDRATESTTRNRRRWPEARDDPPRTRSRTGRWPAPQFAAPRQACVRIFSQSTPTERKKSVIQFSTGTLADGPGTRRTRAIADGNGMLSVDSAWCARRDSNSRPSGS
jgi:hypothetical protein